MRKARTDVEEWWGDTDMPEEVASLIKALASAWRVVLGHRGRGTRRTEPEPELVRDVRWATIHFAPTDARTEPPASSYEGLTSNMKWVPRDRDQGSGTRHQSWDQGPGTRDQGPKLGPRTKDQGQDQGLDQSQDQGPGTRDQGPGTRDLGPGTRTRDGGPKPGPGTRDQCRIPNKAPPPH